jgi:hypothetical protein
VDYLLFDGLSTKLPTFPQSFPHPCVRTVDEIWGAFVDNFVDNLGVGRQPLKPKGEIKWGCGKRSFLYRGS